MNLKKEIQIYGILRTQKQTREIYSNLEGAISSSINLS